MTNDVNINKLIARLEADSGKHLRMLTFCEHTPDAVLEASDHRFRPQRYIECHTAFCLAGTVNLIRMEEDGIDWKEVKKTDSGYSYWYDRFSDESAAAKWLGISYEDGRELFYMTDVLDDDRYDWEDVRKHFDALPDATRRAAGLAVLTTLRETGEVDWAGAINAAAPGTVDAIKSAIDAEREARRQAYGSEG